MTIGKKIFITGILFVSAAFSVFLYNHIMDFYAGRFTDTVINEMNDYIDSEKDNNDSTVDNYDDPIQNNDPIKSDYDCFYYENYAFIGYISIPELELKLPVMSDWNYDKLNISPCRYSGSVLTGDLVIAAHNYRSHFGNIHLLEQGDEVVNTDTTGKSYKYEVILTDRLNPVEINKMTSGECDLTLFTCTWTGTERVRVLCDRKDTVT